MTSLAPVSQRILGTSRMLELPSWPVLAYAWGLPVWWATGLGSFISIILAVPMVAFLVLRGNLRIVPGMWPLIAFVVWTIPCALMLDSSNRLIGYALQFLQDASVVVLFAYVVNAATTLTARRLLDGLTAIWVFVIIGGYLGMLWPETVLTTTVGQLLPGSLRENDYVRDLVFPGFAEIQLPYGAEEPFVRPSAPYAYTNGWGAAIALLTPIVIGAALERRSWKANGLTTLGLAASLPPAIATSNRGLFVGLAAALLYMLVRLVARRRWQPAIAIASLAGVAVVVLAASGLFAIITERQDAADTTAGRGDLYLETFERTLTSPLLGFGAPRPSYTSEISVGTQGLVWNLMFSYGFVGLVLFLWFLAGAVIRTWRAPTHAELWLHTSLVVACVLGIFYGLDRHLITICIVLAVLLRRRYIERAWDTG